MNMADSYCALFSASCLHSRRNCSMAEVGISGQIALAAAKSHIGGPRYPEVAARLQFVSSSVRCWPWIVEEGACLGCGSSSVELTFGSSRLIPGARLWRGKFSTGTELASAPVSPHLSTSKNPHQGTTLASYC